MAPEMRLKSFGSFENGSWTKFNILKRDRSNASYLVSIYLLVFRSSFPCVLKKPKHLQFCILFMMSFNSVAEVLRQFAETLLLCK